jgi:ADP-ribose pyrophosphatase YjhB (NUDIX family)
VPLSPVSVRARAVIPHEGGIIVARERRRGRGHTSIPGGRVSVGETVTETAAREVREETGLEIELGQLLYVVEVRAPVRRHDLNLIFLASAAGPLGEGVEVLPLDGSADRDGDELLPPLLERLRADSERGWAIGEAAWLGNVYDSGLRR